jgi:acyl-CoA thioester hydrolase
MSQRPDTPPLITYDALIRSRYSETDQMGYVYYGRYFEFFEQARTEMLRSMGLPYSKMEAEGVMLPVIKADIQYHRPIFYDELMTIRVQVFEEPVSRIRTFYEVYSEGEAGEPAVTGKAGEEPAMTQVDAKPAVTGFVELCFMDRETRRPVRAPELFIKAVQRR